MKLINLFSEDSVLFGAEFSTKEEALEALVNKLGKTTKVTNVNKFKELIFKREMENSTGIGDGIAIPHALSKVVKTPTVFFASLKTPLEWDSLDGEPINFIFMIATKDKKGDEHLSALSELSKFLVKAGNIEKLSKVKNWKQFIKLFETKKEVELKNNSQHYDVIGITACPTGIAHTYLAEEKLLEYANELNMNAKIETQGRRGTNNKLSKDDIDNAKIIILAHDKAIAGINRFAGKKVIDTTTNDAIFNGKELINNFESSPNLKEINYSNGENDDGDDEFSLKKFKDIKGNLLAGVSRMLPFVVAGGIILGIGFLIDFIAGNGEAGGDFGTVNPAAGWFAAIGKTAMMMMVPILAGYIAYTIVGPQGLMPGIVAGLIADGTGGFMYSNAPDGWNGLWSKLIPGNIPMISGFIGGMVGAFIAALAVYYLTIWFSNFKKSFHGVRDIVLIPLLSLLFVAIIMFVLNIPLGYLMHGIKQGIIWLIDKNLLVLVALIIGTMMCVDMGGPVNKIAYVLGTMAAGGQLGSLVDNPEITTVMGASMAAGMVPPLGIALCTILFRKTWTEKERDAAKSNWLMGAFFISEGAIPFMITDAKRISLSAMIGGATTGVLIGTLKVTMPSPHGGIAVIPLANSTLFNGGLAKGMGIVFFIGAVVVGMTVMALVLGFWKLHTQRISEQKIVSVG